MKHVREHMERRLKGILKVASWLICGLDALEKQELHLLEGFHNALLKEVGRGCPGPDGRDNQIVGEGHASCDLIFIRGLEVCHLDGGITILEFEET